MISLLILLAGSVLMQPDPSALPAVLREIDSELQLLRSAIHDAETRTPRAETYLARASLEVGTYYRNVSYSDDSLNASMTTLLSHYRAFYADAPAGFADARALSLPLREANDTLALVQRALAQLVAPTTRRPPLPSRNVNNFTVCDGYLCNSAGQPVIPSGFNVWAFPKNKGPFDEALTGINIVTTGLGVSRLLPNYTIDPEFVAQLLAELDAALAKNISIHTLGFGSVPQWAEQKWPGIIRGNFTQHGVNFDISSPGVPILMTAGIKAIFDTEIGCHPALGGFILGNEVSFMQSATPAMVSSYHSWLQKRYDDQIALLNRAWTTTFTSFDDIKGQPAKPIGPVILATGTAEWWDWNSFNNWRATAMYSLIANEIQKNAAADPRCRARGFLPMTTLKLQDGNEFNGLRQKGIDREALVDVLTWNGCDSGIAPNTGLDSKGRINPKDRVMNPPHDLVNPPGGKYGGEGWPTYYNKSHYAADWLGQGAGYTLQHSLAPTKPLYDTEWHSIGTLTWRDEHMSPEYVELAVWFTLYHYLAVNLAWYFPRNGVAPQRASKFPGSLVGSFATLPGATDTFLREYMLASALGDVVAALGRVKPTIWILRSMASDTQDETSTVSLLAVFEAASFLGVTVGFVTEKQLQNGSFVPNNEQNIVVVPNSTFVENATVAALEARTSTNSVVLASNTTAACLRFDPSGVVRPQSATRFLDNLTVFSVIPAPAMHAMLRTRLLPQLEKPPAWCVDATAPEAGPVFGVLCRFSTTPTMGLVGIVINLNAQPQSVAVMTHKTSTSTVVTASTVVTEAVELRNGAKVMLGKTGKLMRSGEVLVLQVMAN
tara:strand:- start:207 stop:2702 length:2496 start_codon:yes stop_codon:yes gene_type:complete